MKSYWCVTRDTSDGDEPGEATYKAHGPYETEEAAWAFDDAIEFTCPIDLSSLGTFHAASPDDAVAQAQQMEAQANKGE